MEARSGCPGHQGRSGMFRTVYVSTQKMAGVVQREHADPGPAAGVPQWGVRAQLVPDHYCSSG